MATPTTKTELLKTQREELTKIYTTYDGSGRPTAVYSASANAITGTSCIKTTYSYDGSSARVTKRLEAYDVWDATYDI